LPETCDAPGHEQPEPAAAHSRLCRACRTGIRRDLHRIITLSPQVSAALFPAPQPGQHAAGTSHAIPVNLAAVQWRDQAARDLAVITAWTRDERGLATVPPRTISAMAGWLAPHWAWISYRPWAGGAAGMLTETRRRAQQITGWHPRARIIIPIPAPYGTCPECGQPGQLTAVITAGRGGSAVRCAACGHSWEPAQWNHLGQRLMKENA
jgi:hypothetical protein